MERLQCKEVTHFQGADHCQVVTVEDLIANSNSECDPKYGYSEDIRSDLAVILYTSGTSGKPKGVPVSGEGKSEVKLKFWNMIIAKG